MRTQFTKRVTRFEPPSLPLLPTFVAHVATLANTMPSDIWMGAGRLWNFATSLPSASGTVVENTGATMPPQSTMLSPSACSSGETISTSQPKRSAQNSTKSPICVATTTILSTFSTNASASHPSAGST